MDDALVFTHPFVIGELMIGGLSKLQLQVLDLMQEAVSASTDEVRFMIEQHSLAGKGLGYVDAHLLVSTLLTDDCRLLTTDKALAAAAQRLSVGADD